MIISRPPKISRVTLFLRQHNRGGPTVFRKTQLPGFAARQRTKRRIIYVSGQYLDQTMPSTHKLRTFLFILLTPCIVNTTTAQWKQTNGLCKEQISSFAMIPDGEGGMRLFIGSYLGGVFLSSDHGGTWFATSEGLNSPG